MGKAISSHLVPVNAARGPSGTARYAVRLDGTLAWAGPDFALSAGNPALFANWHVYAGTHPQADEIRFLRLVSERGDVSHQPLGTFHVQPSNLDDFPIYRRVGSGVTTKGTPWRYAPSNVVLSREPQPGVPAVFVQVESTPQQIPVAPDGTADTTALVPAALPEVTLVPVAEIASAVTETAISTVAKPTFVPDTDGQVYGRYTKNGRVKHRPLDAAAIQEYLDTGKDVYVRGHLGKNVRYALVDGEGNIVTPTEIAVVA